MGLNHREKGDPRIWNGGTLMQIVPAYFVTFHNSKCHAISSENPFFGEEPTPSNDPARWDE